MRNLKFGQKKREKKDDNYGNSWMIVKTGPYETMDDESLASRTPSSIATSRQSLSSSSKIYPFKPFLAILISELSYRDVTFQVLDKSLQPLKIQHPDWCRMFKLIENHGLYLDIRSYNKPINFIEHRRQLDSKLRLSWRNSGLTKMDLSATHELPEGFCISTRIKKRL